MVDTAVETPVAIFPHADAALLVARDTAPEIPVNSPNLEKALPVAEAPCPIALPVAEAPCLIALPVATVASIVVSAKEAKRWMPGLPATNLPVENIHLNAPHNPTNIVTNANFLANA